MSADLVYEVMVAILEAAAARKAFDDLHEEFLQDWPESGLALLYDGLCDPT